MEREVLRRFVILFLLVSATLPSESLAGSRRLMDNASVKGDVQQKALIMDSPNKLVQSPRRGCDHELHPRSLMVKTNDYGSYDPSPTMDKPPYKLIPN